MKIVCRADASHVLGTGHVMRQVTLAKALKADGAKIRFLCRAHPGNLADFITNQGFECHLLPVLANDNLGAPPDVDAADTAALAQKMGAEWVFVDHYSIDATWERQQCSRVFVVDDMFDRRHNCDILLNQNLSATAEMYAGLVTQRTTCLTGVDYALLRPEFAQMRLTSLARRSQSTVRNILLTMGGSDDVNATGWVMELLKQVPLPPDTSLTIVMGPTALHSAQIHEQATVMTSPTNVLSGTSDMAGLMVNADLAIGAAGSTAWERCALGLPTVQIVLADNQRGIGQALHTARAAFSVNFGANEAFVLALRTLLRNQVRRQEMSHAASAIVDGEGVSRVVNAIRTFGGKGR